MDGDKTSLEWVVVGEFGVDGLFESLGSKGEQSNPGKTKW